MPHTPAGIMSATVCLIVCLYALSTGRTSERVGAAACLVGLLTVVVQDRVDWLDPERRLLAVDGAMLVIFACLACRTQRKWVIPATAAQLLCVLIHFMVVGRVRDFHQRAYLTAEAAFNYVVLAALAWGAWGIGRRPLGRRSSAPAT